MVRKSKKVLALVMAAALLLGCAACGRQGETDPDSLIPESTGGKDLVRASAGDHVFSINTSNRYSKNPLVATNHSNQLLCDLVYENMIELDENFQVIEGSGIIYAWDHSDDSKTWTLKIEEGHYFHDGSEVGPRDVSYSLGLAINCDRFRGRFASFQGASPGDGEVTVTLGIGDAQFIKLLNIPIIKLGTYGEEREYGNTPIGSGPYTYNEDGTALIAYEGYPGYKDLPVDTIYLKEYTSADEVITAFENGSIDVVVNDPSSYTNLGYASTNEIHSFATTNMHYVQFNEESMLGRFSYFRLAMQYAFDREYLVELLHGNGVASAIPMYPTCADYPSSLNNNLDYNIETCRRILEVAGVRDYDDDGELEFMSGSPQEIDLSFAVCADSSAKSGVAHRFAEDMASIGLKVTVYELTWDAYVEALENGAIKVGNSDDRTVTLDMYYGEVKLRNNFDLTELLQVRTEDNALTNVNFSRSTDNSVVSRIEAYLAASDMARPSAYYQFCEYLTGASGSLITIGFEKQQIITHRGVCKGISANAGNPLYNFANWTIDLSDDQ